MSNMFDKLINRSFVIPISEDQKDIIKECCQNFLKEITVEKFEELCMNLLFEKEDRNITPLIREISTAQSVSIRVTTALIKNIAQYLIGSVFENDDIDDEIKADCSLALRNVLISLKSAQIHIPYPTYLKNGVEFYDKYYNSIAQIKIPNSLKLTPDILLADSIDDIQDIDLNDCFEEIQYYCRIYARNQYNHQIKCIDQECQNINNAFEKAYYIAEKISNQEWTYVDKNPIDSIKKLLTVRNTKASMQRIKSEVTNGDKFHLPKSIHASSILLQYLSSTYNSLNLLDEVEFSPIEFAVALYYEFVFELKVE